MTAAERPSSPAGDPLPLLAAGRTADVFALDRHRVLRRYRAGHDVAAEAALMRYAAGHGFPVPVVYDAHHADMVMERLYGPTMAEALASGEVSGAAAGELLAELQHRLHRLPPPSGDPVARIVHLDLHPVNVMMVDGGPVVIDWRNATEGAAEVDVALTALILAEAASGMHIPELAPAAREGLRSFVASAGPVDRALDRAVAFRSADPNVSDAERAQLAAAAALVRDPSGATHPA